MSERFKDRYVLAFGAPMPARHVYGKAKAACFRELHHDIAPGAMGLHITVKSPFCLTPEAERRFVLRLDQLVRHGRLKALTVRLGSIGRFYEPEDVVYLEVGGDELRTTVEYLLADLDSLGVPRTDLDGKTLHVSLAKRRDNESAELQDLTFGLCSDMLCLCRKDLGEPVLTELMLYDRSIREVARSWTLPRH